MLGGILMKKIIIYPKNIKVKIKNKNEEYELIQDSNIKNKFTKSIVYPSTYELSETEDIHELYFDNKDTEIEDVVLVRKPFIPVTNITIPTTSVNCSTNTTISPTLTPSNATNKTIVWSLVSGPSGSSLASGILKTGTTAGTAVLRATIINGIALDNNYTKNFNITVSILKVTDIYWYDPKYTNITLSTGYEGGTIPLTITPSNATNKTLSCTAVNLTLNPTSTTPGGKASISVSFPSGNGTSTVECKITISRGSLSTVLTGNGTMTLKAADGFTKTFNISSSAKELYF
jgi:hypothetical protein